MKTPKTMIGTLYAALQKRYADKGDSQNASADGQVVPPFDENKRTATDQETQYTPGPLKIPKEKEKEMNTNEKANSKAYAISAMTQMGIVDAANYPTEIAVNKDADMKTFDEHTRFAADAGQAPETKSEIFHIVKEDYYLFRDHGIVYILDGTQFPNEMKIAKPFVLQKRGSYRPYVDYNKDALSNQSDEIKSVSEDIFKSILKEKPCMASIKSVYEVNQSKPIASPFGKFYDRQLTFNKDIVTPVW